MYSFTRFVFSTFLLVLSLFTASVTAAPVTGHDDSPVRTSETRLQDSIKRLKGEPSTITAEQAVDYLKSAESSENRNLRNQAQLWLGRAYRDGLAETSKDPRQAFHYFQQAAGKDGGDPVARYELAQAYYQGVGTDRNLIASYMWVSLSLHRETDVSSSARTLQKTVAGLLNEDQLATSKTLISQLETLYLNK